MKQFAMTRLECNDLWALIYPAHLAMLSSNALETMRRSVMNSSRLWVGTVNGEVIGFCGLIPPSFLSDTAYLWFYGTDLFEPNVFLLVRKSRMVIAEILKAYPVIVGHCVADAEKSHRWLRWLGATFEQPQGQLLPFRIER